MFDDDLAYEDQRRIALYPGTFDPITLGHLDVIREVSMIFDHVVVGVLENPAKKPMFTLEERTGFIKEVLKQERLMNIGIATSELLAVEVAKRLKAQTIVRGVRLNTDFEQELFLALNNRELDPSIATIFIPPCQNHLHISSTAVRELVRFGSLERLQSYLPDPVLYAIKERRKSCVE